MAGTRRELLLGPLPRYSGVGFAVLAVGAGALLGLADQPQAHITFELSGLILAALLTATVAVRQGDADDRGLMPPSFVVDFAALLLLGPGAMMATAAVGWVMRWLAEPHRAH